MPGSSAFKIRISNFASDNLEQIHFYISKIELRPIVANQVVRAIQTKILDSIPNYPFRYPECPARRTSGKIYRQAMVKNYKIIFRIDQEVISIIGVVHASRSKEYIKKIPAGTP